MKMEKLSPLTEKTLKEVLDNRDSNGNCDILYWKNKFESISENEDVILRSTFKELRLAEMVSVSWADNYPDRLNILAKGSTYFIEKELQGEQVVKTYINNFYGPVNDIQIQQGTNNSSQVHQNTQIIDEKKIIELIELIRKNDADLDVEYGEETASKLRNYNEELSKAIAEENSEGRVKKLLSYIRDLSINAGGGLIATGIVQLITTIMG